MTRLALLGVLLGYAGAIAPVAGFEADGAILARVYLPRAAMAGGSPLPAGTYDVRLTGDVAAPALGQSTDAERWVEFVKGGRCIARELATVVPHADIGSIAKGPRPAAGSARIELLKGERYIRVWINRNGDHYIINMPVAA